MIGGLIGYLLKEYRDRLRPMISITSIGQLKKLADRIDVPDETTEAIRKSFSIIEVSKNENLDVIAQAWDTASDVTQYANEFLELIEKLIQASARKDKADFTETLARCLNSTVIERWIRILLLDELIIPRQVNMELTVQIPVYQSSDDDGCVILGLSKSGTSFGKNFNKAPLAKEKCMRFISIVERLDFDALQIFFNEVKQRMINEKMLAKDVEPVLLRLDNENSRWEFQLFIANLGNTPFLIHPRGIVSIKDANGASYSEPCYLVLIRRNEKKELNRIDTATPLIVRGESDAEVSFITTKTQRQMERGNAMRDAFTSRKAKAQIKFKIEKSGFNRFVNLYSPWVDFIETK
jgi:hypothetical protein